MIDRYYWSGISKEERTQAISDIKEIVNRYATILNFQRFSDLSLSLVLETEERRLKDMQEELNRIMQTEGACATPTDYYRDCLVFLNVTFIKSTGDFEIKMPNFPE